MVPTSGRVTLLERCLAGIASQTVTPWEVIVVDNGPPGSDVAEVVRAAGARCLIEPVAGAGRARNAGARAARGDVVAFLDDDAVPEPDWLSAHLRALADPTLSATTGRVRPTGPGAGEDLGDTPMRVNARTPGWFERANFGGLGLGPNLALRRALFADGWGFRESLGPGRPFDGDDHYAFFDLIRRGHALAYVPGAVVTHRTPAGPELAAYRRRMLRGGVAYALMLLVEEPAFRRRVLRYALGGTAGRGREWRPPGATSASRREKLDALLHGPLLYARSQHERPRAR